MQCLKNIIFTIIDDVHKSDLDISVGYKGNIEAHINASQNILKHSKCLVGLGFT